ncbi:MAG: phosphatidylserine decarboxylase family protein [Candidatus Zixiibacteriota bacterium]
MIAREGLPFILGGLLLTVSTVWLATRIDSRWLFVMGVMFALLTLFVTYFFRDPERAVAATPGILVSPADGKVIGIDTLASHTFFDGAVTKISIFLSVFDVHVNRIPITGKVEYVEYHPGKFFAAFEDKASELNERTEIGMTAITGQKVLIKQIAGLIARRIVCRVKAGDECKAGDRFGLIRFGSRTELFVPADSDIRIRIGEHVAGGRTVIGYLNTSSILSASDRASQEARGKL